MCSSPESGYLDGVARGIRLYWRTLGQARDMRHVTGDHVPWFYGWHPGGCIHIEQDNFESSILENRKKEAKGELSHDRAA